MHSDAYFAIGHSHDVCQDHAVAGSVAGRAWALLSDGCSSSELSDYGARLLTRAAQRQLDEVGLAPALVLSAARDMVRALDLDESCLDATLCYAVARDDAVHAAIYGDGVIAARRHDGAIEAWSVSDDDSAPAYLSYLLDGARLARYLAEHGRRRITRQLNGVQLSERRHHLRAAPYGFELTLPAARYDLVLLLSDGASSFRHGRDDVPLWQVLRRLFAIKSHRGRFVARRCRRFLRREAQQLGWAHHDDLSAAGVWLGAAS